MDSCFSGLSVQPPTSSAADSLPSPLADRRLLCIAVRAARLSDLHALAEVLTQSFHPPVGWMSWAYPLLKLGIQEDLRGRLQENSPHYFCLTALVSAKKCYLTGDTKKPEAYGSGKCLREAAGRTSKIAGTIEIALRSSGTLGRTQYAYISNLAVSRSYRRQGIARKLLLSCEPMALDWGFREIYLHVLEDNQQARQLYSSSGYRLYRVEPSWENLLFNRPRRLLLQKTLR